MKKSTLGPRVTRKTRLETIAHWLISGLPCYQAPELAAKVWGTRRGQIMKDIAAVKAGWAEEACREDYLSYLWQSKLQFEMLYDKVMRLLGECKAETQRSQLVRVCQQILKSRDRVMKDLTAHRRETLRDYSPDNTDPNTGEQRIVDTVAGLMERAESLADTIAYKRYIQELDKRDAQVAQREAEETLLRRAWGPPCALNDPVFGPEWTDSEAVSAVKHMKFGYSFLPEEIPYQEVRPFRTHPDQDILTPYEPGVPGVPPAAVDPAAEDPLADDDPLDYELDEPDDGYRSVFAGLEEWPKRPRKRR
jgi:hypothetical protein